MVDVHEPVAIFVQLSSKQRTRVSDAFNYNENWTVGAYLVFVIDFVAIPIFNRITRLEFYRKDGTSVLQQLLLDERWISPLPTVSPSSAVPIQEDLMEINEKIEVIFLVRDIKENKTQLECLSHGRDDDEEQDEIKADCHGGRSVPDTDRPPSDVPCPSEGVFLYAYE